MTKKLTKLVVVATPCYAWVSFALSSPWAGLWLGVFTSGDMTGTDSASGSTTLHVWPGLRTIYRPGSACTSFHSFHYLLLLSSTLPLVVMYLCDPIAQDKLNFKGTINKVSKFSFKNGKFWEVSNTFLIKIFR